MAIPAQNIEHASDATRERILDTAEQLFAERGLEATSVRDITAEAGTNLGAINYHFGTKQKLIEAVFNRHIEPVNRRRLALLDEVERKAGNKLPALEALLEAMIRPAVEASFATGKRNITFMRLMARCHSEPNPKIERLIRDHFQPIMARFATALARSLPGLLREELFWRLIFTTGSLLHALLISSREDSQPGNFGGKLDANRLVRWLIAFAAAGLRSSTRERL